MEEFEQSSRLGIVNGEVRAKFCVWNREWRSSSKVRCLESEMEEFETSSRLGIGNGGDQVRFRQLESGMDEFELSSRLGIGNGGVRAKFCAWNREWRSSS